MTTPTELRGVVVAALAGRELLSHPFYRRWSAGKLTTDELQEYASQYRHIEAALPGWLEAVRDRAVEPGLREAATRNLADEAGGAASHLALFEQFATALHAQPEAPSPATRRLLDEHSALVDGSAGEGLAAILAYELQSPEVARSKAIGLREWYGLTGKAVAFWDVHATIDCDHADWTLAALAMAGADPVTVGEAASRASGAWWSFLDERESARPTSDGSACGSDATVSTYAALDA